MAQSTGAIPNETQISYQTLVACLVWPEAQPLAYPKTGGAAGGTHPLVIRLHAKKLCPGAFGTTNMDPVGSSPDLPPRPRGGDYNRS